MTVHTEILLIVIAVSIACVSRCIPRAAPHVHDGRRYYTHRIPWHRASLLRDGRLKLSLTSSRGNA